MVLAICFQMDQQESISMIQLRSLLTKMEIILNTLRRNKETRLIQLHHIRSVTILLKDNFRKKLPFFNILEIIYMLITKLISTKIQHLIMDIAMLRNGWKPSMPLCSDSATKLFKLTLQTRLKSFCQVNKSL